MPLLGAEESDAAATSSGRPIRPAGTCAMPAVRHFGGHVGFDEAGVTALQVTPLRAISRAIVRVKPSSPALAAA
jgi:hypothetical protein